MTWFKSQDKRGELEMLRNKAISMSYKSSKLLVGEGAPKGR